MYITRTCLIQCLPYEIFVRFKNMGSVSALLYSIWHVNVFLPVTKGKLSCSVGKLSENQVTIVVRLAPIQVEVLGLEKVPSCTLICILEVGL